MAERIPAPPRAGRGAHQAGVHLAVAPGSGARGAAESLAFARVGARSRARAEAMCRTARRSSSIGPLYVISRSIRSSSGPLSRRRDAGDPASRRAAVPGAGEAARTRVGRGDQITRVGNTSARWPRTIVTRPSSRGCRRASRRRPRELGELVEKQDPVIGEPSLCGPGGAPPPTNPAGRSCDGCPERPAPARVRPRVRRRCCRCASPRSPRRGSSGAGSTGSAGEHRLAGPRRALEHQIVAAGGRDLERQQRGGMPPNVRKMGSAARCHGLRRPQAAAAAAAGEHARQPRRAAPGPRRPRILDQRRLACALARHDRRVDSGPAGSLGGGEHPGGDAQLAAQRELAEDRVGGERRRPGSARWRRARRAPAPRRSRDQPCARSGREVRGDPGLRELEARVRDRGADPVPRLPHRHIPEPDDRERGETAADVDFDPAPGAGRSPSIANVDTRESIGST